MGKEVLDMVGKVIENGPMTNTHHHSYVCESCHRPDTLAGIGPLRYVRYGSETGGYQSKWLCESCEWAKQRAYSVCYRVSDMELGNSNG